MKRNTFAGLIALLSLALLSGCASTTAAYKAADGLEETAFVMNQHYLALVREANNLAESGALSGGNLQSTQGLVRTSRPLLAELSRTAQAYEAVQSAETQQELTDAIAAAAVQLSNLVNAIRAAGGSASLIEKVEDTIEPLLAAA